ncbi:MaoC/PaaZ C-terminal domain-containing protein [Chelatococcus sp. YT9]|nr:MaoC/PaaZ C-terminal domain-containing protein [Chelatococcus sp. YT9]MBS7700171.1 MaoC family dehydratase N-terminal domain-containing protein [Chelatococcus sp. YT9]
MLTRHDVAFYALSIGAGRDPCDQTELRFVDPGRPDLEALPSMALVLGYPGFWLGNPALKLDIKRIFHVEQSLEIMGALPVEGRVVGRTWVTDLQDRGVGKDLLVHSRRDVSDERGVTFAKLRQVHMLRGYGGFFRGKIDKDVSRPASTPSASPVAAVVDTVIRTEQALLYRLNGDFNPLHSDPAVAQAAGFPGPILHGMCTFGMVARKLVKTLCRGEANRLISMSARFTGPVHPGETLRTEILEDGSFHTVSVERGRPVLGYGMARAAPMNVVTLEPHHAI